MSSAGQTTNARLRMMKPQVKRTKTGCYCCRLRRKKCDEQRPSCKACERLQLLCSWPTDGASESNESEFAWRLKLKAGLPVKVYASNATQAPTSTSEANASTASARGRKSGKGKTVAEYAHLTNVFYVSPQASLIDRLFADTTYRNLLDFYITNTAPKFVHRHNGRNPYVDMLLPMARSSPMILNAIIAVSGSHASCTHEDSNIEGTSSKHYAQAVKDLRIALTGWVTGSKEATMQLLVTTTLLVQYECMRGDTNGVAFHHLRGSRQFALYALDHTSLADEVDLLAFLLEVYSFFELNNVRSRREMGENKSTLVSISHASSSYITKHKDFGLIFGRSYGLFRLIPQIVHLAEVQNRQRKNGQAVTDEQQQLYERLLQQIMTWSGHGPIGPCLSPDGTPETAEAGVDLIMQNALLAFLHTAFYQGRVPHDMLLARIEPIVDQGFSYFELVRGSPSVTVLLWPVMVLGSCAVTELHRNEVRRRLGTFYELPLVDRALEILEWVWEDPSEESFSFAGLERMISIHNADICIA